jgi:hypothetical protein
MAKETEHSPAFDKFENSFKVGTKYEICYNEKLSKSSKVLLQCCPATIKKS